MRWLMWLLLGVLVYLALRAQNQRNNQRRREKMQDKFNSTPDREEFNRANFGNAADAEKMVKCSYCEVYLPSSEAIQVSTSPEEYFCSQDHARLHATRAPDKEQNK